MFYAVSLGLRNELKKREACLFFLSTCGDDDVSFYLGQLRCQHLLNCVWSAWPHYKQKICPPLYFSWGSPNGPVGETAECCGNYRTMNRK
jgi:hypothetical protein